MDINRVLLVGFAGKDAQTASISNGKSVVKLSVATTKRYKDSANQWREKTQWHDCAAYGELATSAATVKSGAHLLIEGHLVYREYERRIETDGGPVNVQWPVTEIVIDSLVMLDRSSGEAGRSGGIDEPHGMVDALVRPVAEKATNGFGGTLPSAARWNSWPI